MLNGAAICMTVDFPWFSVPTGLKYVLRSWRHRHWNRYSYAWALAAEAGTALAGHLKPNDQIMCHSLGSRVALCALEKASCKQVLIFSGAALCSQALEVAKARYETMFYNTVVRADDVLDKFGEVFEPTLGSHDVIGSKGLGSHAPTNWVDLKLDDLDFQLRMTDKGYHDIQGDNPKSVMDHWYSFRHLPNWNLYEDLLRGEGPF